jgi:hypothetical protein
MLWLILDDYLNEFVRIFGAAAFGFALAARLLVDEWRAVFRGGFWALFIFSVWVALFLSLRLVWIRWAWRKWRERQCSG